MALKFQKASRRKAYLRLAVYGPSGSGKTMTCLRIGAGIAKKIGARVAFLDTERGSAQLYGDRWDFDAADLEDFQVNSYIEALRETARAGYKVVVIDSLSHAWQSLLDEVDRIAAQSRSGGGNFNAWAKVTPKQRQLVDAILNYPGHVLATMRAKTLYDVGEKNGKKTIERLGAGAEQGKGIEYEFTLLGEITSDHTITFVKDRTGKFQDRSIALPSEELGEALVDWLESGDDAPEPEPEPEPQRPEPRREERPAARQPEPEPEPERVDVLAFIDKTRAGAVKAFAEAAEEAKAQGADVEGAKLEECTPAWGCINGMVSDALEAGTISEADIQGANGKRDNAKCMGLVKRWIEADPKGMKLTVRAYYASKVEERRETLKALVEQSVPGKSPAEKEPELAGAVAS